MADYKYTSKSGGEYTKTYDNLRGVDFSENYFDTGKHFSYLENMYADYDSGGNIQSVPGFRKAASFGKRINGIFSRRKHGTDFIMVHSGKNLYSFNINERDNPNTKKIIYADLVDTKSSAAAFGENFYILDGEKMLEINKDDTVSEITSNSSRVYVPTTHINGVKNECRNLLTNRFYQLFTVRSTEEVAYGSAGLNYTVISFDAHTCTVSGYEAGLSGEIYIPSYTIIAGKQYKVIGIADNAFEGNTAITSLITNDNLKKIGRRAFAGCVSLTKVYLSRTVEMLDARSFDNCSSLSYFYIGDNFSSFGESPFNMCTSLKGIHYSKSVESFQNIENAFEIEDRYIYGDALYKESKLSVKLYGGVSDITSVMVNEINIPFVFSKDEQSVIITTDNIDTIFNFTLKISGLFSEEGEGFLSTELGKALGGEKSILGSKAICAFDNRLFISGNPMLAGIMFFSEETDKTDSALYFSTNNYIIQESSGYLVSSMSALNKRLIVFTSGTNSGSIFCHTAEGSGKNKKYPLSLVLHETDAIYTACEFMGEAVFASSAGIYSVSVSSTGINTHRLSDSITKLLSAEKPQNIRIAKWCGYLVVSVNGRIYLADSRDEYVKNGCKTYNWYFLNGIGTYKNSTRVYRYSETAGANRLVHPKPDTPVYTTVYSSVNDEGIFEYYTKEPEGSFSVYPTEEYQGGSFYPATEILGIGELLLFGTECGDICIFNNDKRGTPPPYISESESFDPEEYKRKMGNKIHPYYYSFDNRKVKYALATPLDNCGTPSLEKATVKGSLAVKLGCLSNAKVSVFVKTDREGAKKLCTVNTGNLDFDTLSFSDISFDGSYYTTAAIKEYKQGWIEKQIILTSDEFCAPISIHSIAYRYKIKGNIRNK